MQSASLPNPHLKHPAHCLHYTNSTPFSADGETWETPLTFQVNELSFADGASQLSGITINGVDFPVNQTSTWNSTNAGYYYYLFVELWLYNSTLGTSQYNNRFVSLVLNMTQ